MATTLFVLVVPGPAYRKKAVPFIGDVLVVVVTVADVVCIDVVVDVAVDVVRIVGIVVEVAVVVCCDFVVVGDVAVVVCIIGVVVGSMRPNATPAG